MSNGATELAAQKEQEASERAHGEVVEIVNTFDPPTIVNYPTDATPISSALKESILMQMREMKLTAEERAMVNHALLRLDGVEDAEGADDDSCDDVDDEL